MGKKSGGYGVDFLGIKRKKIAFVCIQSGSHSDLY